METLDFKGRRFELAVASTVQRDIDLANALDSAGVKEAIAAHITDEDAMNAAITQAFMAHSDQLFNVMGCSLIPAGTDPLAWTREMGRETANFLRTLPGEEFTKRVLIAAVSLARAFFMVELLSIATSQRSLQDPTGVEQLGGASAEITTSATGG